MKPQLKQKCSVSNFSLKRRLINESKSFPITPMFGYLFSCWYLNITSQTLVYDATSFKSNQLPKQELLYSKKIELE